jgi:hypothetical protein
VGKRSLAHLLDLGTGETKRSEIPEDKVVLGTGSAKLVVVLHELGGDSLGVLDDLGSIFLEGGGSSLLESDGDTSNSLESKKIKSQ